jgi:uncharacterized protein (PEP-CTERM system associated)
MTLPSTSASTAPACALLLATTAGLLLGASPALAQDAAAPLAPRQTVSIVPRVSLTETATSNVLLATSGAQSDVVTELSPGIRINIEGARLKTYFDYAVSEVAYARTPASRRVLNALNTFGTLEAVDNWAFIDFSGAIAQQAISAFGKQSSDPVLINANQAEVSSLHISPYVRGRWGELATYEARYSRGLTHRSGGGSNDDTADTVARIAGIRAQVGLGWALDAGRQTVNYGGGRSTDSDHINLALPYAITPQFTVSVNGGRESNNYSSITKQSHGIAGFGFAWAPSALTSLTASRAQHSFGAAHSVSLDSRSALTAWRFSDVKDVAAAPGQTSSASRGSVYDLLFSQFASLQPDPLARAQLVNAYLQRNGMAPNVVVTSGFLTSTLTLQRRQDLSFALLGVRDTVTLLASRSQTRNLDTLSVGLGDLANSAVLQQRGFSVNLAHRLTPDYSLGVLLSEQLSSGSPTGQDARQRSLVANLAGRVSSKATLSLGLRRVISGGGFSYAETAVTGNLNVPF